MIPIAGSAYTYTYATMGELVAWIIGWDLILEYAVSNMAVTSAFAAPGQHAGLVRRPSETLVGFLPPTFPAAFRPGRQHALTGPVGISALTGGLRHRDAPDGHPGARHQGVRADQQHHGAAEIIAILVFVTLHPSSYIPRTIIPSRRRLAGNPDRRSIVFFTYIGFDSVSTAAEECKRPQRDLRLAYRHTVICTLLYVAVVVVLTGLVKWDTCWTTLPPSSTPSKNFISPESAWSSSSVQ